jgi:dolichyl-phosphate-mannose-protein mannosyltransferase
VTIFVAASVALIATAGLGASIMRLGFTGFLLAAYLFAVGEIVVLTEALSLAGVVGKEGYLAGQAVVLSAVGAVWLRRGRPLPILPRIELAAARSHPIVSVLALAVGVAVVYQAVLVVTTPPNNWDSLTYHLSRAAAWLQQGAVDYFPSHTERANVFPPNAEIEIAYTLAFVGRDTFAAAPQFLAELASVVAVYGCARRLSFAPSASLFGALMFATLTQVALQSVTTQNDLVATSFVVSAAYFVLGRSSTELMFAGLAVGLAVGTKLTVIFAAPALVIIALAALSRRQVAQLAASTLVGLALVGAYGYALNTVRARSPVPLSEEQRRFSPEVTFAGTVSTAARTLYDFVDFSGFHPDVAALERFASASETIFDWLGIERNPPESTSAAFSFFPNHIAGEDDSYFGPLGVTLVLPLSLGFTIAWLRRRASRRLAAFALALPAFLLSLVLAYSYNRWLGRFMIIPVALTMPLAAWVYSRRLLAACTAVLGVATLVFAHGFNEAKPIGLDGTTPVWKLSREQAQSILRPEMEPPLAAIASRIPARATIGYVLGIDDWDYPLYGRELRRRLVNLQGAQTLDGEAEGLSWVVLGPSAPVPEHGPAWRVMRFPASGWKLLERMPDADS